jgi:hypothetical protein
MRCSRRSYGDKAQAMNPSVVAGSLVILTSCLALLGWLLSLYGGLGANGYYAGAIPVLFVWMVWLKQVGVKLDKPGRWSRYLKGYPLIFLITWALAVLGGFLHAPNNIDALTYRLPRVMHWLAEGQWHWIATNDLRMNYSATAMEWQMLPFLVLLRSDRLLFLINAIPALLMPGLLFSFLRQGGVAPRVAWRWMWLLPLAPVYALQTGSIGNDALGVFYFLAACRFLRLAGQSGGWHWLTVALLAAGLLTGIKASNLPLLLPLVVIGWNVRRHFVPLYFTAIGLLVLAMTISALPTLALNQRYSGHWSGDPGNETAVRLTSPVAGLTGNLLQGGVQNMAPPVFPWARTWSDWAAEQLEPAVRWWMQGEFQRFTLRLGELPQEEWAGLGLPLLMLLLGSLGAGLKCRFDGSGYLMWSGMIAALSFCAVMGSEMTARLLAPYYPVLTLFFLRQPAQTWWIATRSWRCLAILAIGSTWIALLVSPARPILPMARLAGFWSGQDGSTLATRAKVVYETYARRADPYPELVAGIPVTAKEVSFLGAPDDAEISLWRPYGTKRVYRLRWDERPSTPWVLVRADVVQTEAGGGQAWLRRWDAQVVNRQLVRVKASGGLEEWWLVKINPPGSGAGG